MRYLAKRVERICDELLDEDYVDCLWCCLTMEGKEDKFIWAGPYMYTQRVVVVPADSEIETLEDLAEKCVAVHRRPV